jgi:hypothetical protein
LRLGYLVATQLTTFKIAHRYGDIGYLCQPHEITETIGSIIHQNDSNRYKHQVKNMLQIKGSRIPETLAIKYRELVGQFSIK